MATLIVEISHRCPCFCRECPVPLKTRRGGRVMSLDEFCQALRLFAERFPGDEQLYLIISGGEPSIIPRLCSYVVAAKEMGYRVTVVTNGFDPETVLGCEQIDLVEVSLDYADPEKHDAYRGVPGLWERAYTLAKRLYPRVVVRTTWLGDNTEDILRLAEMFPGRVFCMPAVVRCGSTYAKLRMPWHVRLRLRQAGVVLARECDHSRFATIDPDLNVLVCPFVRIVVGRLSHETLDRLARLEGCPASKTIKMTPPK